MTEKCSAAIKYMTLLNQSMKRYATPYLTPNLEEGCVFRYICENDCPHKISGEHFTSPLYPNEKRELKSNELNSAVDPKDIIACAEMIADSYRFLENKRESIDNKVAGELMKFIWDENRTVFGREYDRIICTNFFRRLQYKTQVMVNSASDDQRTRLLHSLEVQRVAKKIAMGIGANWELAETIAIAHDIGHTPFGHTGEYTINEFLTKKNYGRFSHALQSVRVLDHLCRHPILEKYSIKGLGISSYVLEGVLKHDADTFTDGMQEDHFLEQLDVKHLCGIVGLSERESNESLTDWLNSATSFKNAQLPQVLIGSVESQIVAWADKIAYLGHDWEEFIDTQLLEKMMSRVNDMVRKIYKIITEEGEDNSANPEYEQLTCIWEALKQIGQEYAVCADHPNEKELYKTAWKEGAYGYSAVQEKVKTILESITQIESEGGKLAADSAGQEEKYYRYFSAKEYRTLKNYFLMTVSWVKLLEVYPRGYGLKHDPIYVFYMYLTDLRPNVITPRVVQKIIDGTIDYVAALENNPNQKFDTRDAYLLHCNKLWTYKYNELNNKYKTEPKKARRRLKDTLRTCFLVGFHDYMPEDDYRFEDECKYIMERDEAGQYYSCDTNYGCMLNIIKVTIDEFIGSTRVKFMKHTADEIVRTLLEYYVEHPDMLPYAQRNDLNEKQYHTVEQEVPEISEKDRRDSIEKNIVRSVVDYVAAMTDRPDGKEEIR